MRPSRPIVVVVAWTSGWRPNGSQLVSIWEWFFVVRNGIGRGRLRGCYRGDDSGGGSCIPSRVPPAVGYWFIGRAIGSRGVRPIHPIVVAVGWSCLV